VSAPRLEVPPCDSAAVLALARDLGVAFPTAQVLVRRGIDTVEEARRWLSADEEHPVDAFPGLREAADRLVEHVGAGRRITVHGDYDVDGVSATAILVRALRAIGADVDWHLPHRTEDGYGLSAKAVRKLRERGTDVLLTADCGITSVDEVALARSLGMDVIVCDHHSPRADRVLPDAPIVHPAVCGYPCVDLCAAGVAHKLAGVLLQAAGHDATIALTDLDLVALATVADCVPLRGENRRLVRAGLRALARTEKVGLRALMRVASVDPSRIDATALGFRLAPRLNAAGRLARADAALELLLTHDPHRAEEIAVELDRANAERRFEEARILHEAESQIADLGDQPAYVLWGETWHPGVIGIVASRIAERHHRPALLIALRGEEGTGSGRSIPAFDLLAALDACAEHLLRHGGHRAAAGCTVAREELHALREAFVTYAAAVLSPEDLVPSERVDAVVAGDELGLPLAEELGRLAPFGTGNPSVSLLLPAARLVDPRPMGEGRHLRFTVEAGGVRASAVAFGMNRLPEGAAEGRLHATFELEVNEFRGAVEPRLVLRKLLPADEEAPALVGEPEAGSDEWVEAVLARARAAARVLVGAAVGGPAGQPGALGDLLESRAPAVDPSGPRRELRDRRGGGIAGTIGALVHTGEPVLVVAADALMRARHLRGRLGGFDICSWETLQADPSLADDYVHVVALDPPLLPEQRPLLDRGARGERPGFAHLAWGEPELRCARDVLDRDLAMRPGLVRAYRALRDGRPLVDALGERPALAAGRMLAVLAELSLVVVGDDGDVEVPDADRTELERSSIYRHAARKHAEGMAWLSSPPFASARAA